MKILTDFYNYTVSGNVATGYFLNNLKTLDTNEIWMGTHSSETLIIDLGSSKRIGGVFLNNANFTSAIITCASNSGFSGGVSKTVTLKKDDLGICKAFIDFANASYRYIRIECSVLISGSYVSLGNVIIAPASEIVVSEWNTDVQTKIVSFESDGGAYREKRKGQSRHSFSATLTGTKESLDSLPFNSDYAVIYTDLNDVSDCYLIGAIQQRRKGIKNPIDCSLSVQFSELT